MVLVNYTVIWETPLSFVAGYITIPKLTQQNPQSLLPFSYFAFILSFIMLVRCLTIAFISLISSSRMLLNSLAFLPPLALILISLNQSVVEDHYQKLPLLESPRCFMYSRPISHQEQGYMGTPIFSIFVHNFLQMFFQSLIESFYHAIGLRM